MKKEILGIISNEKTYLNNKDYFCDNLDMKSIPEGLNNNFDINLFVRNSKTERLAHKIEIDKIISSNNIFSYIVNVLKNKKQIEKYLIISLSPYTFVICLLLFFLKKKAFLYLRSDGYEEYKCYSKFFGPIIYHIMFSVASSTSRLISCRLHILKGKIGNIVSPSQLDEKWFAERKKIISKNTKLLYVGRIRVEKGVHSLLKILNKIKKDYYISIISSENIKKNNLENKNINFIHFKNEHYRMIKEYDNCSIFILPSYTEGHPQVLDEALSRLRPVIIFPEISHVIRGREGVFISERTPESLLSKINFIESNYESIQNKIEKNILPDKKNFLKELEIIINKN